MIEVQTVWPARSVQQALEQLLYDNSARCMVALAAGDRDELYTLQLEWLQLILTSVRYCQAARSVHSSN